MTSILQLLRKRRSLFSGCLLWLVAGMCGVLPGAYAQHIDLGFPETDGEVTTIARDGNYTYIGGSFNNIGVKSVHEMRLTTTSDIPAANFPQTDGAIVTCAPDGSGGWYVGGYFSTIGTTNRNGLAHILPSGQVDNDWDPDPDGSVKSLAIRGLYVYLGGYFNNIGGQPANYLARVSIADGSLDASWNPDPNDAVNTIAIDGSGIYAGGAFTAMGAVTRNHIAKLDTTTGAVDGLWDANADNDVNAIGISGASIYVAGSFGNIGLLARSRIAKLNNTSGAADAGFTADASDVVNTMVVDASGIYVGGFFTSIDAQTRNYIAKLNSATGTPDAGWDANASDVVNTITVNGSDIYAGGLFTNIGLQTRSYLARLNSTTGAADLTWDPRPNNEVTIVGVSGTDVFVGGWFTMGKTTPANNLIRIDTTTGVMDAYWNPNPNNYIGNIAIDASGVYVTGAFNNIGAQSRTRIAKLDKATGAADPGWDATSNNTVTCVAVDGTNVYVGGYFTSIGGQSIARIARLDNTTGAADAGFNPNPNSSIYGLAVNGTDVYALGLFNFIGGQSREYIAKLNSTTGAADASWNANADNQVISVVSYGSDIYVGGYFNNIGGQTRNYIARLNTTTGDADAAWNPNADNWVNHIAINGTDVFAAGNFDNIGGQYISHLARVNATSGAADPNWKPTPYYNVNAIDAYGSYVYAGGSFFALGFTYRSNLARISTSSTTTYTWTGAISNNVSTSGNWDPNGLPLSADNVIIPSGTPNAPNLNGASYTLNNFTQNSGQTVNLGTGDLTINGTFDNSGTITGSGKIYLNSPTAQDITGTGTVSNLEIDNSNGVTIAPGSNKLNVTGLLTLSSGTLTTNDNLVLKSTSPTASAMVGPIYAGFAGITGNVTHERYLSAPANGSGGRSWRLLTSPIGSNTTDTSIFSQWQNNGVNDGTGIELFSPAGTGAAGNGLATGGFYASIRSFDYVTNTYNSLTNTKTTALFTGTQNNTFLTFVTGHYGSGNIGGGASATNADATGTLITGTQNYTFTPPNATNIYYLMGNPYACPIDFDKVYNNAGTSNINRKFWVVDPNLSSIGAYATVTYTGGIYVTSSGNQNQYIQTGQGFFVEGNNVGNASTVEINENNKETTAPQTSMFRTNGGSLETFRVKLYKNINSTPTLLDGAVVASHQTSNNGIDGVDGLKFGNFNENIGILSSGKVLAIDARQLLDNNDTVKVSLSSMQQTTYQLVIEPGHMNASGLYATLIDNFTNTITPVSLSANTTYSFTVTSNPSSTGTGRFKVIFNSITPLDLKFVNTSAIKNEDKVDVQWTVANQDGIRTYDVERSSDAKSFTKIGTITAGSNNMYSTTDETPLSGNNYYRIKAIARSNENGLYSNIVRVNMNSTNAELTTYPNPVKDGRLQISVSNLTKGIYFLSLYNAIGQKAAAKQISYEGGSATIDMNIESLATGVYLMQLTSDNGETIAEQKIVKQ